MKGIFVDIERCTACKACEIACAVEHSSSKSLFGAVFEQPSPQKRVHVEPALAYAYPVRCLHCSDAPCVVACPNGAMTRDVESGVVAVNEDRCQGCFMCAMVCSFGAISAHPTLRVAIKCDQCTERQASGQEPACVGACPTQALQFGDEEDLAKKKRLSAAARIAHAVGATPTPPSSTPLDTLRTLRGL